MSFSDQWIYEALAPFSITIDTCHNGETNGCTGPEDGPILPWFVARVA